MIEKETFIFSVLLHPGGTSLEYRKHIPQTVYMYSIFLFCNVQIYKALNYSDNDLYHMEQVEYFLVTCMLCRDLLKPSIRFYIHSKAISSSDVIEYVFSVICLEG